ncbi:MAG: hypothetical protein AB7L65_02930 [Hyphomonadaceae bacterium]
MKAAFYVLSIFALAAVAVAQAKPQEAAPAPGFVGADARSVASDADVRVARRACRAACVRGNGAEYCECMTGAMAQILAPADLQAAAAAFAGQEAAGAQAARVAEARAAAEPPCATFRSEGAR